MKTSLIKQLKRVTLGASVLTLAFSCLSKQQINRYNQISPLVFLNIEKEPIDISVKTKLGLNTGWNIYEDIMFPGTSIEGRLSSDSIAFKNMKTLHCQITGGDAYNNVFFTNTLAKKNINESWEFNESNKFEYQLDFFVNSFIDEIHPNKSEVEGLEFTFQHAHQHFSNLWALQWNKSNQWSLWNDNKLNEETIGWESIPALSFHIQNGLWNTIAIQGHHDQGFLYYDGLIFNGMHHELNIRLSKALLPPDFAENYIQVGFQINGNTTLHETSENGVDPVSVYLKNVSLKIW